MNDRTFRVFAQSPTGRSSLQCNMAYDEAHEAADALRASGWRNVQILPDQPSLAHVTLRNTNSEVEA